MQSFEYEVKAYKTVRQSKKLLGLTQKMQFNEKYG